MGNVISEKCCLPNSDRPATSRQHSKGLSTLYKINKVKGTEKELRIYRIDKSQKTSGKDKCRKTRGIQNTVEDYETYEDDLTNDCGRSIISQNCCKFQNFNRIISSNTSQDLSENLRSSL